MPIANWTTSVPVVRTASAVQKMLADAGARKIAYSYDDGEISGLAFAIEHPQGDQLMYELPVRSEGVLAALRAEKLPARYRTPAHANRVAWRILHDWLRAQLALIQAQMSTLDEIMLPYLLTAGNVTLFQRFERNHAQITGGAR